MSSAHDGGSAPKPPELRSAGSVGSGAVSEAVGKVEQELARFWTSDDAAGGPKVRASTMNYVVAGAAADVEAHRDAALALAEVRAGRVFLLSLDGRLAPWDVATEVSMTCQRAGDDQVCHDRVEIAFGAGAAARAASVVATLALAEVPVILEVARGAPAQLVDAVAKVADRVVVDSAHTSFGRLAELLAKSGAPVADRAMVRTFSFRELVARFFDGDPGAARAVDAVSVTRTAGAGHPEALLLGWLGSRLGWTWASRASATDASGRAISVQVVEQARVGLGPDEIVAVELRARGANGDVVGAIARTADPAVVDWSLAQAGRERTARHALGFKDETWVGLRALDPSKGDATTREALGSAAAWLRVEAR